MTALARDRSSESCERGVAPAHQGSLFGHGSLHCGPLTAQPELLGRSTSVLFQPGWLHGSDRVFEQLRHEMPWREMQRPMYDRIVAVPRLICTIDVGELGPDHPLRVITAALERQLGTEFAGVGLNYYRSGSDSVAWHRDRVGGNRSASSVALVSVGCPRTLRLRPYRPVPSPRANPPETPRATPSSRATVRSWQLGHGDLLVMSGACQRDFEHCVPKERGVGPRISLAFRTTVG